MYMLSDSGNICVSPAGHRTAFDSLQVGHHFHQILLWFVVRAFHHEKTYSWRLNPQFLNVTAALCEYISPRNPDGFPVLIPWFGIYAGTAICKSSTLCFVFSGSRAFHSCILLCGRKHYFDLDLTFTHPSWQVHNCRFLVDIQDQGMFPRTI